MSANIYPRLYLKPKEEIEVLQGSPWVYDNEIATVKSLKATHPAPYTPTSLEASSVVEVFSKSGVFLGTAIANPASRIVCRIFSRLRAEDTLTDPLKWWETTIERALRLRRTLYREDESYRLIFAEADFIPGFICDRYCDTSGHIYLVVQFLSLCAEVYRKEILKSLRKLCHPYGIYERSEGSLRIKEGLKERVCFEGEVRDTKITIKENGTLYHVDIAGGQKTGHFLDQAVNRLIVANYCKGLKVLDAFCHTGGFGITAALKGAKDVTLVDISEEVLAVARENIALNKVDNTAHTVCKDVFDQLRQYEETKETFDAIILDPPAFAKNAQSKDRAYGGYKEINLRAMRILKPGGLLVSSSCSHYIDSATFYDMLLHAARDSHRSVQIIAKLGAAPDHPILLGYPKSEYLKCAIMYVL